MHSLLTAVFVETSDFISTTKIALCTDCMIVFVCVCVCVCLCRTQFR